MNIIFSLLWIGHYFEFNNFKIPKNTIEIDFPPLQSLFERKRFMYNDTCTPVWSNLTLRGIHYSVYVVGSI